MASTRDLPELCRAEGGNGARAPLPLAQNQQSHPSHGQSLPHGQSAASAVAGASVNAAATANCLRIFTVSFLSERWGSEGIDTSGRNVTAALRLFSLPTGAPLGPLRTRARWPYGTRPPRRDAVRGL